VHTIIGTKLLKNGQMCISVDYILVPRADLDTFVNLTKNLFAEGAPLSGYTNSLDNTGIISSRHVERLVGLVTEAESAGVQSIALGGDPSPTDNIKRQLPLTLLIDPPRHLKAMTDEIFGPVLPILPYDSLDTSIDEINAGERPLGLYVFSPDVNAANTIINNTNSGGAAINCVALQGALPSLPFGGSGMSGMGRHHGVEGFREFSNPRGVFTRPVGNKDMIKAFLAPYSELANGVAEAAFQHATGVPGTV
jgi:coniferyl-aldehyde dehydrogenase